MNLGEILAWLREEDEIRLGELWRLADTVRRENVGDDVHLRGLIEFSNECVRTCLYCGLRAPNEKLKRYRMTKEEILECVAEANRRGYGTIVLQSGECEEINAGWLGEIIEAIKAKYYFAITLSVGERSLHDYLFWQEKGADRYLLKFETSDTELLRRLHPPRFVQAPSRIELLKVLREIGYQIGGGIMVGLPGQTYESVARDIEIFAALDLDMIGIGPYIPNPDTPLDVEFEKGHKPLVYDQIPNSEDMALKVLALARIVCPKGNIPATTALATVDPDGWEKGLRRGANVIMPNLTPLAYRSQYEIYPNPLHKTAENVHERIIKIIRALGRSPGKGWGDRIP